MFLITHRPTLNTVMFPQSIVHRIMNASWRNLNQLATLLTDLMKKWACSFLRACDMFFGVLADDDNCTYEPIAHVIPKVKNTCSTEEKVGTVVNEWWNCWGKSKQIKSASFWLGLSQQNHLTSYHLSWALGSMWWHVSPAAHIFSAAAACNTLHMCNWHFNHLSHRPSNYVPVSQGSIPKFIHVIDWMWTFLSKFALSQEGLL